LWGMNVWAANMNPKVITMNKGICLFIYPPISLGMRLSGT
jgi:hypothetical protein